MEQHTRHQDLDNSQWERLSALQDGECTRDETALLTRQWVRDTELQAQWHAYHMIGDTLRSEDLSGQGCDAAFLQKLRIRLADEPVMLAPEPLAQARLRVRWHIPVGAAAAVLALAGTAWLLPELQPTASSTLAAGKNMPASFQALSAASASITPRNDDALMAGGSAQFNRYLSAHQQFQSAAAIAPVTGYMRHANFDASAR